MKKYLLIAAITLFATGFACCAFQAKTTKNEWAIYGYKGSVKMVEYEATYIIHKGADTLFSYQVVYYNRDGLMDSLLDEIK